MKILSKKISLPLALLMPIVLFQNCAKKQFSAVEIPNEIVNAQSNGNSFLLIQVNNKNSETLEVGQTYRISVQGSEDVVDSGLNYQLSRLIKVEGSCPANSMQPWVPTADAKIITH